MLPQVIERALQQAVADQVLAGEENDGDYLLVNMSSNRLHHAYQSHCVTVGEWRQNEEPVRHLFLMMSRVLNSNEQFRMDVMHIRNPGPGSGRKRVKLRTKHIDEMLRSKMSVMYINNEDDLCCARALVTIRSQEGQRSSV